MDYNLTGYTGNNVTVDVDTIGAHYEAFKDGLKRLEMGEDTNFYIMAPGTMYSGIFSNTMTIINPIEKFVKQVSGTYKIKPEFDSHKVSEALNEYY